MNPFLRNLALVMFLIALCFPSSLRSEVDWREDPNYHSCLEKVNNGQFPDASFQIKDLYCQLKSATMSADFISADQFLPAMDSLLARESDSVFIMRVKLDVGRLHRMQGRYENAFLSYTEALNFFKSHELYDYWGLTLIRLAEYYRVLKKFDLAESHLELAVDLDERFGPLSAQTLAILWHRYAAISIEMHSDIDDAIAYSKRSLEFSEPNDLKQDMATSYLELGYLYYNIQDERCEAYYKKALSIWRFLGLRHYEANTLFNLARLHYSTGDIETCQDYLDEILELNKTYQLRDAEYDALYLKSDIAISEGKHLEALKMRERAGAILIESMEKQHDLAIEKISNKYESDLTKRQLELAQSEVQEAEEAAVTQKRIQAFFAVLLFVLVGLGVTLFIFYRRLQAQSGEVFSQREKIEEQNRELTRSLLEKETLLQEVHHRVQNNLQFILALIEMQAESEDEPSFKGLLSEFSQRVMSIALVHEQLHIENKAESVAINSYISKLIETLEHLTGAKDNPIEFDVHVTPIQLDVTRAVAIGMIINELVTNSMKYAFDNQKRPKITVMMKEDHQTRLVVLEYADNGSGIDGEKAKGLGTRLIDMFGRRLKGKYETTSANGLKYRITFTR